jgi:hypothetical protein
MTINFDEEFVSLAREIVSQDKSHFEWAKIESDDMFQSTHFQGGYDATEEAFCFSHYGDAEEEHWFQLTLVEMKSVADGSRRSVVARPAE